MRLFATLLSFLFVSHIAVGWGATGHRAMGRVAEQHMSAKAKKKLKEILNGQSLAMASTWMDEVRSDSTYNYMNDWHWVTIETGETYEQSKKNPNGDALMTLERVIAELRAGKLDRKKEMEAVKILIHLVGDIHQPLHVGCCKDEGANKVTVRWFRAESNLHRVWDSDMINDTQLSYTEFAESLGAPDKATIRQWQKATVRDWAYESMAVRDQVYATGGNTLGYKYGYKNLPLVRERVLKAGVRLAGVLNNIYR